ncbi:fumarylacetoacetase [Kiloniella sp. b19]|uniref:fumarylacetoacetase n=1 Tax=Kiloniella sp. GXU_MW_B19 TaxID=3141326 RepID=UPI0031D6E5F2
MSNLLRSWVQAANERGCPFPLNNLPYGVFDDGSGARCGVAIGDRILDVTATRWKSVAVQLFDHPSWNAFMAEGPDVWAAFRAELQDVLSEGSGREDQLVLVPMERARLLMPFAVCEYTDFYASRHHATNVGTMFRGAENALPPNWLHMPIGYNGRASSVVISGTDIRRPRGQIWQPDPGRPVLAPSSRFDFELELGAVVGQSSSRPLSVQDAHDMIFGYVLLNDWSARDLQAWEYQPLGPFQSKATATTVSPWIVPSAALQPFAAEMPEREVDLLDHLRDCGPMLYDIELEVGLKPGSGPETIVTRTNYRHMYYSAAQQLAHHSSSGCPMRVGDLLGSGTISGPKRQNCGSMLELSWGGKEPLSIAGGARSFLEDGDCVSLYGQAVGEDYVIGFGACKGRILPAD